MRQLTAILAAYQRADACFDAELSAAREAGEPNRIDKAQERRRINDMAYFVLCWGQFEAEIDDKCRNEIRRRRASADWAVRRGWDIYNPDDRRLSGLSFPDRVALLTDRGGGKGSPWTTIMQFYEARNLIAHGTLPATGLDIVVMAQQFFRLQSRL